MILIQRYISTEYHNVYDQNYRKIANILYNFKCIILEEKFWILIQILLKCVRAQRVQ